MQYINSNKPKDIRFTKDNFYVAIDFDRTITSRASCGTWDVCGDTMGYEFLKLKDALKDKYAPIELDYSISYEEKKAAMVEWWTSILKLHYEYGLTQKKLEESINLGKLIFRTGAKEFLYKMHKMEIPVVILSAGIGNVIKIFLTNNDCYYDNIKIISNLMEFDENGRLKQSNNKLIHTLNKTMNGHITQDLALKISNRPYRLLIGDFIEDKNMVPSNEWDKTVSIGFLDANVERNLEFYKHDFDVVLTDEDANFDNINRLVLDNI